MNRRLDTIRHVETPEGVQLELRVAGPVVRAAAFTVDQIFRVVFYSVASAFLGSSEFGQGLFLLVLFAAEWFYPVTFEVLTDGMTPGKRIMGIAV